MYFTRTVEHYRLQNFTTVKFDFVVETIIAVDVCERRPRAAPLAVRPKPKNMHRFPQGHFIKPKSHGFFHVDLP